MMANSTNGKKPAKPYADFPLFPHASGRWAKKIRGKFHYFGKWDDWKSALEKYLDQKDDLHAGRVPRSNRGMLTIRQLCNEFLNLKKNQNDTGELSSRTFSDYHKTCKRIISQFGKERAVEDISSSDFSEWRSSLSRTLNATSLGNTITRIRTVFKFGYDAELIDRPVRFGPGFKRPSRKAQRLTRQKKQADHGKRMFEAGELRMAIEKASRQMRAMILLGINCGFGQSDIATLPQSALAGDWIEFPRPKTAVERRCPLWPETVEAVRVAIESRPVAKLAEDSKLAFITRQGARWVRHVVHEDGRGVTTDAVNLMFCRLLRELKIKRHEVAFYALRHTFQTIGGESKDPEAVSAIMGHVDESMASKYRESISDERLMAVTDTVREWLFNISSGE